MSDASYKPKHMTPMPETDELQVPASAASEPQAPIPAASESVERQSSLPQAPAPATPDEHAPRSQLDGSPVLDEIGSLVSASPSTRNPLPRWATVAFLAMCLLVMIAPLALTPLRPSEATAEKRELAAWPELVTEEGLNADWLSEAGTWYADHFALRNELIDLDATVKEALFHTSATDNVVVGSQGWLYYAGELNDWRRSTPLSDRAIRNAAHNLALIQEVLTTRGKRFVVAIAPNKSTLYPEHMPPWQLAGSQQSNAARLQEALQARGVSYVDLFAALSSYDKPLYLQRDSHWNNEGALLAAQQLLQALGHAQPDWYAEEPIVDASHIGDLDAMLHPVGATGEAQSLWPASQRFSFVGESQNVEDATLHTTGDVGASGSLLMFRDSFGNALLPYMASSYAQAHFSKLMPYDLGAAAVAAADDVVIERAERHVASFATNPPYLSAPERTDVVVDAESLAEPDATYAPQVSINGPYVQIEGTLDSAICANADSVLLTLQFGDGTTRTFEAFRTSKTESSYADTAGDTGDNAGELSRDDVDYGYVAYINVSELRDMLPECVLISIRVANETRGVSRMPVNVA